MGCGCSNDSTAAGEQQPQPPRAPNSRRPSRRVIVQSDNATVFQAHLNQEQVDALLAHMLFTQELQELQLAEAFPS